MSSDSQLPIRSSRPSEKRVAYSGGRFSGATHGFMAAHIAPEAVRGGPIGALSDGDEITIDVDARRIDVALGDREMAARISAYEQPARANGRVEVAIEKYAKLVGSAAEGAVAR